MTRQFNSSPPPGPSVVHSYYHYNTPKIGHPNHTNCKLVADHSTGTSDRLNRITNITIYVIVTIINRIDIRQNRFHEYFRFARIFIYFYYYIIMTVLDYGRSRKCIHRPTWKLCDETTILIYSYYKNIRQIQSIYFRS